MDAGTRVRFLVGHLGTTSSPDDTRMSDYVMDLGDEGTYVGPHTNPDLARKGWHFTEVPHPEGGAPLLCPVHIDMIEPT